MGEEYLLEVSQIFIDKYHDLSANDMALLISLIETIKRHGAFELENHYVGHHDGYGKLLLNLSDRQVTIIFQGIENIILWDIV